MRVKQVGFSLIEVMITMLVMAIGLLGLAALQIKSVQFSQASLQQSLAAMQASDMAERLWSNLCVLAQKSATDELIAQWQAEHERAMPQWQGQVIRHDATRYTIQVSWQDPKAPKDRAPTRSTLAHRIELPALACELEN